MKKFLYCLLIVLNVSAVESYVDYSTQKIDFDSVNVNMKEAAFGLAFGDSNDILVESNIQRDSNTSMKYFDIGVCTRQNIFDYDGLFISWEAGIGFGQLDVPWYSNKNTMISLPFRITLRYYLANRIAIHAGIGYKFLFDLTDNQTYALCKDGTRAHFKST